MVDKYYDGSWTSKVKQLEDKGVVEDSVSTEGLTDLVNAEDSESKALGQDIVRLNIAKALQKDLNDEQKLCFTAIIDELRDRDHDAIILKGYAGTGKTYLIKKVIEYLGAGFPNRSIAVTAPTNKAVAVLKDGGSFNSDSFTQSGAIYYKTIHKLLGLRESIDRDGVQSFKPDGTKKIDISNYRYLIVDEVSMLNDELFEMLMLNKNKLSIIFMGDPAQIPPINKEHCAPFGQNSFNTLKLELTQIMRQAGGHPIVDYSMMIRQNLGASTPIDLKSKISDNKGVLVFDSDSSDTQKKFKELMIGYYKDARYTTDVDYVKTIAWTNKAVESLNDIIRTALFGKEKKTFNKGDKLIATGPIFRMKGQYNVIKNNSSDEFIVKDVKVINADFNIQMRNGPKVSFDPLIYDIDTGEGVNLRVIHEDSLQEYNDILKELKQMAINNRNKAYWTLFYDVMKWNDAIGYNYAITAHKSQGSTYENVFLMERNLNKNRQIVERNRIKYTAYTRASDKLYILK